MMPGDHVLEPLRLLERERVLGAATRTGQVDVLRLGPAVILGARLEVRVFYEEVLGRDLRIEVLDEPDRLVSNWFRGVKRMPVRVTQGPGR